MFITVSMDGHRRLVVWDASTREEWQMRRVPMVIAAGVTTAIIVLGVNALAPVGAQEKPDAQAQSALLDRFADCMRDRGVAIPALQDAELDRWLDTARLPIAEARACKTAVAPVGERKDGSADARKLATCLRAQGLDAPTDPMQLKRWIGRQDKAAVADAFEACGFGGPEPSCGAAKDDGKKIVELERNDDDQ
jgi:hypothetical protein